MKVLYLTNLPSPYRVDFFNELGKYCELTVLFESKRADDRKASWLQREIIRFRAIFLKGKRVSSEHVINTQLFRWLKNNYDIIVVGGYSTITGMMAISYLRLERKPFIISIDCGYIKGDSLVMHAIKKHFISSANYWLSTSKSTDQYLEHYGAEASNIFRYSFTSLKRDAIIDRPISGEDKTLIRQELSIDGDFVIVSIGQFIQRKGFDILIRAARLLHGNTVVYIIGGKPLHKYEKIINENNIDNVRFVDFLPQSQVVKYLSAADMFILPTREDIWGLVINEAMAQGLPIITTDKCVAGIELIENNVNGFIVKSENVDDLVSKANYLIDNRDLLEDISEANLLAIKGYTIENMAMEHLKIFESILKDLG